MMTACPAVRVLAAFCMVAHGAEADVPALLSDALAWSLSTYLISEELMPWSPSHVIRAAVSAGHVDEPEPPPEPVTCAFCLVAGRFWLLLSL